MNSIKFLFIVLAFLIITNITAQEKISAAKAKDHVGETVIITDSVAQVTVTSKGMGYLNFGDRFPNHNFTAVIFKAYMDNFKDLKKFEGKKVEIKGKVELYREKPQIVLKDVEQIKIVE